MTRGSLVEAAARAREQDRLEELERAARRQDGEAYRARTKPQKKYRRKRNHRREYEQRKARELGVGVAPQLEGA